MPPLPCQKSLEGFQGEGQQAFHLMATTFMHSVHLREIRKNGDGLRYWQVNCRTAGAGGSCWLLSCREISFDPSWEASVRARVPQCHSDAAALVCLSDSETTLFLHRNNASSSESN